MADEPKRFEWLPCMTDVQTSRFQFRYKAWQGTKNVVSDTLSRVHGTEALEISALSDENTTELSRF